MNYLKTALLMTLLTLLLVGLGQAIGGPSMATRFFVVSLLMNLAMYFFSDRLVLKMYRARRLGPDEDPELHGIVGELAQRAGLPMPAVYEVPSPQPNAFATGRSPAHAAVAVTTGIRSLLSREQLRGVLAHELAHVRNRDMLIATVAAALAGAIGWLSHIAMWTGGGRDRGDRNPLAGILALVGMIFAPIAAILIQAAISRSREYAADRGGAEITGDPNPLADALERLESASHQIPMEAVPATAHLFIVNPLTTQRVMGFFSTHPPIRERVARLRAMAEGR